MTGLRATARHAAVPVDWLDPLKAFALVAILLNHFVESFGPGPWFTNPANDWPDLATRLHTFFPHGSTLPGDTVRFLGWLGDSGPGVFVFASGVGLTLAALARPAADRDVGTFYRRRAARLYPLYVAMHFVILAAALAVPGNELTFGSPATLASLLGVRATPALFFYISPSWWFVWLIIQLYVLYPLLLRLLERWGPGRFFALTLAFTVASRGVGILFSHDLYYWMTGLFFGSRLAEFTAGMVVAWWLSRSLVGSDHEPAAAAIAGWALVLYVIGLACSVTLIGSLVSNLLVTLGLSGLFYSGWRVIRARSDLAAYAVTRLGGIAYAVFLLHQPPLKWTGVFFGAQLPLHVAAATVVLVASLPAAAFIERAVTRIQRDAPSWIVSHGTSLSWLGGIAVLAVLFAIEPRLTPDGRPDRALCVGLALAAAVGITLEWRLRTVNRAGSLDPPESLARAVVRRAALAAAVIQLFVLPPRYGYLSALAGCTVALAVSLTERLAPAPAKPARIWGVGAAATILIAVLAELALGRFAPREVGGWGERPALMVHPTWTFGLIPNRVTRLRYNDYDYVVRTNQWGLAGPQVAAPRPAPTTLRVLTMGDAFTMPEGVSYAQSYSALLDSALTRCLAPRPAQVIDAGVTGYGPREEGPQFAELGALFRPDIVVHEFFVNDWSDITIDSARRRREIGLTGRPRSRAAILGRSHLVAHARDAYETLNATLTGHPSPTQRWKLLLDYYRRGPNPLYDSSNVARMTAFLVTLRDDARRDGAQLLIVFTPGGVTVLPPEQIAYLPRSGIPLSDPAHYDLQRPLTALAHITDSLAIPLLDLTGPLRAHRPQPVYYPNAWHWTPEGHRAAAAAILGTLAARGVIESRCAP